MRAASVDIPWTVCNGSQHASAAVLTTCNSIGVVCSEVFDDFHADFLAKLGITVNLELNALDWR